MAEAKSAGNGGMQKTVETYSKGAHQAVDRAAEAAAAMAGRIDEKYEAIGAKGEELLDMKDAWLEGARDYVREKPFQALGIAVAAGFLLNMILRGK